MSKTWVITECPIDSEFKTGVPDKQHTLPFRLLDDDKVCYFKGMMKPTRSEGIFKPLDRFSGWGCTILEVRKEGKWQVV
jgi:hypothetical protein